MKTITTLLIVTLLVQSVCSQDIKRCREIVKITTETFNAKSAFDLEKYLAPDFEIAGQKGQIARTVLNQLFAQLEDQVQTSSELSSEMNDKSLKLIYSFKYSKMGAKNATFVFDEYNKIRKLELFKMEVKTMDNSKFSVQKQKNDITKIPFFMIGKLMAVEVLLNNMKRIFLLDSGSPKVILNASYIEANDGLNKKSISSAKGVGGSLSGLNISHLEKLEFSGIVMENQDVLTLDISHIEKSLETEFEIYGLIGYEIIKDYDLLFDYAEKELTLINPSSFNAYRNKHLLNSKLSTVPFDLSSHIPVFNAQIDNNEYSFGIDCGAETNLMDDDLLEPMSKHLKNTRIDTLSGANKNRTEVTKGLIKKTTIGGKKIKNMKTVFSDMSHLNKGYNLKLDGLMGYELLSKQKTLISYSRKEMILME